MSLEQAHVIVIGLIASVVVWLVKRWAKNGSNVPSAVLTIGVYMVSLALAVFWSTVTIPTFPPYSGDIAAYVPLLLTWCNDLLGVLGGYVAFATLIYQAFVKYLLEHGIPMAWEKISSKIRSLRK